MLSLIPLPAYSGAVTVMDISAALAQRSKVEQFRRGPGVSLQDQRVLFVLVTLGLGGAERQALLQARLLKELYGAKPQVLGLYASSGRVADLCRQQGMPCEGFEFGLPAGFLLRLRALAHFTRKLRRIRPDFLLPSVAHANIFCGLTWRLTQARNCVWSQLDEGLCRIPGWVEDWGARLTPYFAANSPGGIDFLRRVLHVPPQRIHLVRNGVELPPPGADRATWRVRLGTTPEAFVACMVANLHNNKDHPTLLRAWQTVARALAARGHEAMLALAGRPDNLPPLQTLARELDIERQVRFLGSVDDVSGLLHAVDAGVFSSLSEGCPNGVLECMAAGLPVAGTDIPGIREAVGPDGLEFLAPPRESAALAARILRLAENPPLRSEAGARMKSRIAAEFDPREMCQRMARLLTGP